MKRRASWMVLIGLAAGSARAAPLDQPLAHSLLGRLARGLGPARVGQWVSYRARDGEGRVSYWRIAAVAEERDRRGRDSLWIEIEVGEHPAQSAPLAQVRLLVARDPGSGSNAITRLFFAAGADPAAEVEPASLERVLAPSKGARPDAPSPSVENPEVRAGGERVLTTPAGSVRAIPVEVDVGGRILERFWVSAQLPLIPLARLELPAIGHLVEVQDYGLDARPRMILPDPKGLMIRLESGGSP